MSDVTSCVAAATPTVKSWRIKENLFDVYATMENYPFLAFISVSFPVSELHPLLFNRRYIMLKKQQPGGFASGNVLVAKFKEHSNEQYNYPLN